MTSDAPIATSTQMMADALTQVWSAHATLTDLIKSAPPADANTVHAHDHTVRALDAVHLLLETVITPHVMALVAAQAAAEDSAAPAVDVDTQSHVSHAVTTTDKDEVPCKNSNEIQEEETTVTTLTPTKSMLDDPTVQELAQPAQSTSPDEAPVEADPQHMAPAAVEPTQQECTHKDQDQDPLTRKRSTKLRRSSTRRRNSDVRRTLVMMDLSLDRHLATLDTLDAKQTPEDLTALEQLVAVNHAHDAPPVFSVDHDNVTSHAHDAPLVSVDNDNVTAAQGPPPKEEDTVKPASVEDESTDHSGYLHILDPTEEYDLDDSIALAPPSAALDSPPPLPVTALPADPTVDLHAPPSPAASVHAIDRPRTPQAVDDPRPPTQPHSPPSSPDPTHPPLHHLAANSGGAPRPLASPHSPDVSSAELAASPHHSDTAVDEARAVVSEYAAAATRDVMQRAEHEATLVAAAAMSGQGEEKRRSLVASVASTVSPRQSLVGPSGLVRGNHPPPMMSSTSMPSMYPASPAAAQESPTPGMSPRLSRASTAPADPSSSTCPPSASPPTTKSVGFSSTVSVVSPPADAPPNPALAAAAKSSSSSATGGAKRAMNALRKAIQSAATTATRHRSRSTSPGKNAARTPYPDHPVGAAAAAAGAVDLTRNESTLSRRIHEADANMLKNAHIIAMAARAEEERQRQRHAADDVWHTEPSTAPAAAPASHPRRRSSAGTPAAATAADTGMPAKQAMDMLAGATPATAAATPGSPVPGPDRFLPPSVAEQQRWSRSTISTTDKPAKPADAPNDRTLAPIPARSVSSSTSSGPTPSRSLTRSASSSSAASTDSLPELWPLVELSLDRQASLRHRAHLLIAHIARDAVGYYASNEPREKWAHAPACHASFLAYHAAPTIQMLHQAGMKVTLAQLVHALGWVAQGKGRARGQRLGPAPPLPEVPTPDVLQHVQRTLLGFVASFTDVAAGDVAATAGAGGMPASIQVAGLATALFASPVVHAAAARFATTHPVVFRMLDRITALLVLARLTGLALLYPVPGAPFSGDAMVRAVPRGTRVPASPQLHVGRGPEDEDEAAGVNVEEPVPDGCEVAEGFKVDDGFKATGELDEEENVAVGLVAKRQRDSDGSDRVGMLVFPGLVDAQGHVVSKAWVLVE